tara:strand:- start:1631 stop:2668 length:1038 start_codon:yes stop_codon:yes gene_type:complete
MVSLWFLAGIILAIFPKRLFITVAILLTLRSSLGWPLLTFTDIATACRILDWMIVAVAVASFIWVLAAPRQFNSRPWFKWQHSAIAGAVWLALSVGSLVTGFLGAAEAINDLSRGFVQLSPRGITFAEKVLQKDGCRVHLVGLAHIGEGDFYTDLKKALKTPIKGKRLVLTEGVTDTEEKLPPGFKSGNTYKQFAEQLGLEQQKDFAEGSADPQKAKESAETWEQLGVRFINADIDVSELSETHLSLLIKLLKTMDSGDLLESFVASSSLDVSPSEMENMIVEGLIGQRNAHLMSIFDSHHHHYEEIYIPWGAAHLPDLERRFLSLGFSLIHEKRRIGIGFGGGN